MTAMGKASTEKTKKARQLFSKYGLPICFAALPSFTLIFCRQGFFYIMQQSVQHGIIPLFQ
ncbi:hypothetical protein OS11_14220 [Dickeya oryzae]